jgi:phosphate ABC transporter phosphate-binding protein
MRTRRALLAGLALGVTTLAVVGVGSSPAFAGGPTIAGTGSSYAAIAIDQWVGQVEQLYGDNINYSTSSSVIGLNDFAQSQVLFGASEIGYSTGQANNVPPAGEAYQYLPDVAGATCLMFNVGSQTSQAINNLRLNVQAMMGIFTGTIKRWNDQQLQALNPGVLLPDAPIVVVYRTEASGENYIFSDYLDTLMPAQWNAYTGALGVPSGPTAIWPTPQSGGTTGIYNFSNWVGEQGSDNASNYVASTGGTITYVETGYALEHHMPCAAVENASGRFLEPSEEGDAVALTNDRLLPDLEQLLTGVFESPQAAAYPISAYSYFVTTEGSTPAADGQVFGQFVQFVACRGQQAAGALGYSPIPPNLVADDFAAIRRINGAADPGPLNGANCPNPYLTGQLQLPGEPIQIGTAGGAPSTGSAAAAQATAAATGSGTGAAGGGTATSAGAAGTTGAAGMTAGTAANAAGAGATAASAGGPVKGLPPPVKATGQIPGVALSADAGRLLGVPGPTNQVLGWCLAFAAVVALAPTIAVIRRRRRNRRAGSAPPGGPVGPHIGPRPTGHEEVVA